MLRIIGKALLCCLIFLTGCTQRAVTEDGVVVGYSPEVFFISLASIVLLPVGYFVIKRSLLDRYSLKIGCVLIFLGIAGPVLGIPSYFMEKFEITKDGVYKQTGIFGVQKSSFSFDDVQSVVVEKTLRKQSGGLDYIEYIFWLTKKNDGGVDKVLFNDKLSEVATDDVIKAFKNRNIPLQVVER